MAWSPVRRSNAGRFGVDHLGDYATFNSNHSCDGTWMSGYYHGLHKATSLDIQQLAANLQKIKEHCNHNPQETVFQAVEKGPLQ